MLDYLVKILKMFPNEVLYAGILGDGFRLTRGQNVSICWSSDRNIIDVRDGDVRSLSLQNKSDIVVEDRD